MSEYDLDKLNRIIEGKETPSEANEDSNYVSQEKGNLFLAIIGGLLSSVLVSGLWALITVNAQKQWMIMGIFAGLAVGFVVRLVSRGRSLSVSIVGGVFALIACMLGDYFTNVGFIAQSEELGYFETLSMIDNAYFFEIAFADFDFFSLIVYGIAAYEGFAICNRTD